MPNENLVDIGTWIINMAVLFGLLEPSLVVLEGFVVVCSAYKHD